MSDIGNIINYCRTINGSKGFDDRKSQLQSEMTTDYNIARPNVVTRFSIMVNTIDGKDVYINNSDTLIRGVIDVKRHQTADTEMEETVQVYPNQIKCGDYLKFKVNDTDELRDYIITSKIEKKHGYDEGVFKECNHLLKWVYKGNLYDTQVIISNQTKYTLGISTIVAGITEGDSRYVITLPYNSKTQNIKVGQRFIFNANAWKVTQTDFVSDVGLLSILLGQDSINTEIDDVDNEIANKWEIKHNYDTTCTNSLSVTKGSDCGLVYSFLDNGNPIDNNLINIENTSNLISIIKSNDGKITITGVDIGTGSFKIKLNLTDEVREFIVNFEVVSSIVSQVNYEIKTSNGYVYRTKEGSTISAIKYENGVIQNNLIIEYQLDSFGQDLLNKQNISIVKKTDSSFTIRNLNINVLKTFTITIIDKNTGEKILNSQTITLKGM
jgi:hypothetical protein